MLSCLAGTSAGSVLTPTCLSQRTPVRIATLPFEPREAMLVGERMQLHLYEPECCAALCHATVDGHGCFGQLMEGVPVMPLLKVVRSSPHPEAEGFSVHVQCVGRVSTVLEKDSTNITTVEPYQDIHESDAPAEPEMFPEEIADVMLLHQGCCGFQKHIDAISQGDVPPVVIPPNVVYTWGHESYVEQFEQPLQEIFQQRCRNLQEVDMDAAPLDDLACWYEQWGVEDEKWAKRQLLSFASCSCLPRRTRLEALLCRDTGSRFRLAEQALRARFNVLRARSAVAGAVG